jgi:hypothetical protein
MTRSGRNFKGYPGGTLCCGPPKWNHRHRAPARREIEVLADVREPIKEPVPGEGRG